MAIKIIGEWKLQDPLSSGKAIKIHVADDQTGVLHGDGTFTTLNDDFHISIVKKNNALYEEIKDDYTKLNGKCFIAYPTIGTKDDSVSFIKILSSRLARDYDERLLFDQVEQVLLNNFDVCKDVNRQRTSSYK